MRRIDLGLIGHAHLVQERHQRLAELAEGFLRLPDIDDSKAVCTLTGGMNEQTLGGPVRRRLHPSRMRGTG
jgi:hypothetical protein